MRRLLILSAVTAMAAVAPAGAALAAPPEVFQLSDSGSEPGFVPCDGYDIDLETTTTEKVTIFFDGSGEVVKFLVRSRATDIFTNSVTAKTVVNRGVFQKLGTRIDGTNQFTEALVGFRFIGTSPGEGLVLQDVGRIVYSGADEEEIVFLAGQHHVPDGPEAEEVFCAALA